jgi:subtilisin family serine protease
MKRVFVFAVLVLTGVAFASENVEVNEFIVKAPDAQALQAFVADAGLAIGPLITYPNPSEEVLERFGYYYIVTFPEEMQEVQNSLVDELKRLDGVEYVDIIPTREREVEPEIEEETDSYFFMPDSFPDPYIPNDPMYPQQWAPVKTETNWAWNVTTGEGVVIAIIDSGVDTDHEDLVLNLDLEHSYNVKDNNTNIQDNEGHGTRVSGTCGAKIDNNEGITGIAGDCSLLIVKDGDASVQADWTTNGILYAADNGAMVINISSGFEWKWEPMGEAVNYAWGKGCFLSASAGNDGDYDPNHYPSSDENVMSAGNVTPQDTRYSSSNYGANVDIYAPGSDVLTTDLNGEYDTRWGTSYAAPHIAGLAALIWSVHPDWTNQQVWDKIIESADTITIDKGKVLRMNARKALDVEIIEGITEQPPVTHPSLDFLSPVGSEIVLRFQDSPKGFHAQIFDPSGRQVDELHVLQTDGTVSWPVTPGAGHSPGVYFIVPQGGNLTAQKVVLVR